MLDRGSRASVERSPLPRNYFPCLRRSQVAPPTFSLFGIAHVGNKARLVGLADSVAKATSADLAFEASFLRVSMTVGCRQLEGSLARILREEPYITTFCRRSVTATIRSGQVH